MNIQNVMVLGMNTCLEPGGREVQPACRPFDQSVLTKSHEKGPNTTRFSLGNHRNVRAMSTLGHDLPSVPRVLWPQAICQSVAPQLRMVALNRKPPVKRGPQTPSIPGKSRRLYFFALEVTTGAAARLVSAKQQNSWTCPSKNRIILH